MKILIVDDSKTMQRLIEKTVKELGYDDLLLCDSAKSALDVLKEEKLDLILLDWHMPEMSGLELLRIWKTFPMLLKAEQKDMSLNLLIKSYY